MNKAQVLGIGCIIMAGMALFVGGCPLMYGYNAMQTEVSLRNLAKGQSNTNEASLDTMWKIIQQKCEITGKWSGDQLTAMKDIVAGRSGGALFKSVQEVNPAVTPELFKDAMNSVEAERKRFLRDQKQLMDYIQLRQTDLDNPLKRFFITTFGGKDTKFLPKGDSKTPEDYSDDFLYTWVTSGATKEMVKTGEENDVELFKEKAPKAAEKDDK